MFMTNIAKYCYNGKRNVMLILIAEAKTMLTHEWEISPETFLAHHPSGEEAADNVMSYVSGMSVAEIAAEVKLSSAMAAKLRKMALDFPDKLLGYPAIEAYTGVVFKAFDYSSLTPEEKERADRQIRLISSLYGWLAPRDIIKPYRFDYTTPLAPGDMPFSTYWRKDVTIALVKYLQQTGETSILHLLPGDAARCIDWKLVKRFAKVWKVDFKELHEGGAFRTPTANRLKTARGELLRHIIRAGISDPSSLLTTHTDHLLPMGTPDYPDHIAFCL